MSSPAYAAPEVVEPKRVLVTGGAGFLGSHLCDRLLRTSDLLEQGLTKVIAYFDELLREKV